MANEFKVKNGLISPNAIFPGSTSGTSTLVAPAVAGTSTITLPGATGTLATIGGTETLTNKTLTSPTINTSIIAGSASMDIFNTTATTINFGGAATTMYIGPPGAMSASGDYWLFGGANGSSYSKNIYIGPGSSGGATNITLGDANLGVNTTTIYGTLKLGHASDTTLSRSSAGVLAVEGVAVPTISSTSTLTNKSLSDSTTFFIDEADGTKKMQFELSGIGTGATRTLTVPNTDGTIITSGDTGTVTNTMLSGSIANSKLVNSSITINGNAISLGDTATITANTSNALTVGTGLQLNTGTTFDGGAARTISIDSTVATLTGSQTFTNKTLTAPVIDNIKLGYTTTATAAGTTTLTVSSNYYQRFTGTTTETVVLPVTSTLVTGMSYAIENASTGNLTVNSSGGNLVATVIPGTTMVFLCIGTALTTAADWDAEYDEFAAITGTGSVVLSTSPTFTTSIDGGATFSAFASSTSLTLGYGSTAASTTNISTGAVAAATTKTINIGTGGAASSTTNINLGSSNGGTVTVNKDLVVTGDLTVNGTTTTVNSTTITVDDKNIELGSVVAVTGRTGTITASTNTTTITTTNTNGLIPGMALTKTSGAGSFGTNPVILSIDSSSQLTITATTANTLGAITFDVGGATNNTADGGGITLKGATDKTFNWVNATSAWTSSEHVALASGKNVLLNGSTSGTITLAVAAVAGTNTVTFPATTGNVVTTGDTSTVTNTMLSGSIAAGKLTLTSANIIVGNGSNVGAAVAMSGDATIANTGALTIANSAVTYAKIQNVSATDKILGRSSSGAGVVEEITCTSAGRALLDDADASTQRTTLGLGSAATMTGPSGTIVGTSDSQTLTNKTLGLPKFDISAAVSAAGSNQAGATALTTMINNVTTVAASTGVVLPTAVAGYIVIVRNGGANALNVYPATGAAINAGAANAAHSLPIGAMIQYVATSATQWYTMSSTFA